jgi:hypothetical protein
MTNQSSHESTISAAGGTQSAAAAAAMRRALAATTNTTTQCARSQQHSQRRQWSNTEVIILDDSDHDDDGIEQENSRPFHNVNRKSSPKKRPAQSAMSPLLDLCNDSSEEEDDGSIVQLLRHRNGARVAKKNRVETMLDRDIDHRPPLQKSGIEIYRPPRNGVATSAQSEENQLARAIAASNRDITSEQDQEYYESLRNDEEKERAKRAEEQNKNEEEELQKALDESVRLAKEENQFARERERQYFAKQLDPEPTDKKDCATVAFRLPSRCSKNRIERKFHIDASADQLLVFLHGCKELQDISKWTLREVLGGKEIKAESLLRDLELAPRGLVIVREEES